MALLALMAGVFWGAGARAADIPVWSPEMGSTQLGDVIVTYVGGALKFSSATRPISYVGDYLPSQAQVAWGVVAENANLDDYDVDVVKYGTVAGHSEAINLQAPPRYVERSAGAYAAQFMRTDSSYTKGVKLRLRQNGANIEGQVVWAKYVKGGSAEVDFDPLGAAEGVNIYTIATQAEPTRGYGVDCLTLVPKARDGVRQVRMASPAVVSSLTVENGVSLLADKAALTQANGALPPDMVIDRAKATFAIDETAPISWDSQSVLSGTNGTIVFAAEPGGYEEVVSQQTIRQTFTKSFADAVLPNTRLADLVGTRGWLSGDYMSCTWNYNIEGLFFDNRGEVATCQYQFIGGNMLKCVMMELKQVGADIQIATPYGKVKRNAKAEDLRTYRFTPNDDGDYAPDHYNVTNAVLTFTSRPGTYKPALVTLAGTNTATGLSMVFAGNTGRELAARVTGYKALPSGAEATVDVGANAVLTLMTGYGDASCGVGDGKAVIRVRRGGELRHKGPQDLGYNRTVDLDGGKLCMGLNSPYSNIDYAYVRHVIYRDGAETYGAVLRGGNGNDWSISARGDAPSVARNGIMTVSQKPFNLTFDIDDVTKDAQADFTVQGGVSFFNATYNKETLVKTGPGTMRWEGVCTCRNNPMQIAAGALELGKSGIVDGMSFTLTGGALTMDPGTAHVCGQLTVTEDSRLTLTEGATITFASFGEWTKGKKLLVSAPENAKVRIHKTDLPTAVLRAIRLNGSGCILDEDGYLVPSGFAILVK